MSRRLGVLATIILLLFAVAAAQAANIQFFKAPSLDASPTNPRNTNSSSSYPRGQINAADGTVLAYSVKQNSSSYPYRRIYPDGSLFSGILGFSSPWYGLWGLEDEYNGYLAAHPQPPQSIEQVLAPTSAADSITPDGRAGAATHRARRDGFSQRDTRGWGGGRARTPRTVTYWRCIPIPRTTRCH